MTFDPGRGTRPPESMFCANTWTVPAAVRDDDLRRDADVRGLGDRARQLVRAAARPDA